MTIDLRQTKAKVTIKFMAETEVDEVSLKAAVLACKLDPTLMIEHLGKLGYRVKNEMRLTGRHLVAQCAPLEQASF